MRASIMGESDPCSAILELGRGTVDSYASRGAGSTMWIVDPDVVAGSLSRQPEGECETRPIIWDAWLYRKRFPTDPLESENRLDRHTIHPAR